MTDEMLEILVGKYLDGQIAPGERDLLETELEQNSDAKELFEQLQELHQSSRETISSEILEPGKSADEIFEQAWQKHAKSPLRRLIKVGGHLRFATGLAAGLIIGYALHFTLIEYTTPLSEPTPRTAVAQGSQDITYIQSPTQVIQPPDSAENILRNVGWYNFTDETGNQWLIEGTRESIVKPAVYSRGL
ncbi:MAG: hypothetical protein PVH77_00965 [Phycisphaerales bacterium]|jgi:hypothetical protein